MEIRLSKDSYGPSWRTSFLFQTQANTNHLTYYKPNYLTFLKTAIQSILVNYKEESWMMNIPLWRPETVA
jgi:hypothetical protein